MEVKITDLHPTQLYLSEKKLQAIQMLDQSADIINVDPISVLAFGNRFLITDGHHRAYQALLACLLYTSRGLKSFYNLKK